MSTPSSSSQERVSPTKDTRVIRRELFDLIVERAVTAENLCKDLLDWIARDQGEWRSEYGDYAEAAAAILQKEDV
jgi:type II secretory pathway component PulK